MLYSFDVFDTVITRTTYKPRGIFALMGDCYDNRILAEENARKKFISGEIQDVTLDRIYDEFEKLTGRNLKEKELQTEYEQSLPVRQTIDRIKSLLRKGERVVLISDMYLSESDIRKLLLKHDEIFADIPIYVSSEYLKTKLSGDLYRVVAKREKADFKNWIHIGDNPVSDVNVPKELGIQTEFFSWKNYCRWLEIAIGEMKDNIQAEYIFGATANLLSMNNPKDFAYEAGAGYAAPVLYPYVKWVVEQAAGMGIKKLFFVARDGYILKKMADKIIAGNGLNISTEYIFGSRRAWRLPAVTDGDFDIAQLIKWSYPRLVSSYDKLAEVFDIEEIELKSCLPDGHREKITISESEKDSVFSMLEANKEKLKGIIADKQKDKRKRVKSYLDQTLGNQKNYAFVELIGSGYTQKCLSKLLKGISEETVRTFYYKLDAGNESECINYSLLNNNPPFANIIEVLCAANHGQTIDYSYDGKEWKPVFGEDEGQFLDAYGFESYLKGIEDYTDVAMKRPISFDKSVVERLFKILEKYEDEKLYDFIADMPYSIRGVNKEVTSYAPRLTTDDIWRIFYEFRDEPVYQHYAGYNIEYSIRRLTGNERQLVYSLRMYNQIKDNVIIYGAGKKGQLLKEQLTNGSKYHANVVAVIDKKYDNIDSISKYEYDQIIISVANKDVMEEIKSELVCRNIPEKKILWVIANPMIN